ncbi:MAG: ROK family protein [Actinomycetales bacterium]
MAGTAGENTAREGAAREGTARGNAARGSAGRTPGGALRQANLAAVLAVLRGAGPATGTDLIAATGLSRATVIAVCDSLAALGWARELDTLRDAASGMGRPARRFEFNASAGAVLGIDVGPERTTVVAADLAGRLLGRSAGTHARHSGSRRLDTIEDAALEALDAAGLPPSSVLAVGAGVAAAVDRTGHIPHSQRFWESLDLGLPEFLLRRRGWPVLLENDANVAALAEHWLGAGAGVDDLAVLLAGERLGAGLLESGRLLHGSRGGAGEMAYLDLVEGVGSPEGIGRLVRRWGTDAAAEGSALARRASASGGELSAEQVFAAAADGDATAAAILDRVAERMARVVATLGTMFNPELVVLGGGVADSAAVLLTGIRDRLPRFTATPPRVEVSVLGDSIVPLGAVRLALDYVERNALSLRLSG